MAKSKGNKRGNVDCESQNSKTKSKTRKYQFSLKSTLLGVGGLVGLIFSGSPISGQGIFAISKAQAAEFPVSAQFDLAKQALTNAAPVIQQGLPGGETSNLTDSTPATYLEKPLVAETKVTKDPVKTVVAKKKIATSTVTTSKVAVSSGNHYFPYGYCTYYVSTRRAIPWSGNAGTWLSGARSYGYATGSEPRAGAILVTYEGGRAGHVAYVEAVNGDQVTISEMNFRGFGVTSSRVISAHSPVIKGFIY